MHDPERDARPDPADPLPPGDRRASLVPRWMAALVLVVLLAAGALSAWLVVHADLARSGRVSATGGSQAAEDAH